MEFQATGVYMHGAKYNSANISRPTCARASADSLASQYCRRQIVLVVAPQQGQHTGDVREQHVAAKHCEGEAAEAHPGAQLHRPLALHLVPCKLAPPGILRRNRAVDVV